MEERIVSGWLKSLCALKMGPLLMWKGRGPMKDYEFAESKGIVAHDSFPTKSLLLQSNQVDGAVEPVRVATSPAFKNPYQLEIEDFVNALKEARDLRVTPDDAIEALKISLAAIESSESGQPVDISNEGRVSI